MAIVLSVAIQILDAKYGKDEKAIEILITILDILKYPLLNLVDIAFIDFGLKLMIVLTLGFTNGSQNNTPMILLRRLKRAILIKRALLVAFAIFVVFFALQDIYNCIKKPRKTWFLIASYS